VSRSKYAKAISAALEPVGFLPVKRGSEWRREAEGFVEEVSLQGSRTASEVTVNFALRHDRARRTVQSAAGPGVLGGDFSISGRIGQFLGPKDRWWASGDPAGPSEVADLLLSALMPYLEEMRAVTPYVDALKHRYLGGHWPYVTPILELAVLLHENGETEQAREILGNPPGG